MFKENLKTIQSSKFHLNLLQKYARRWIDYDSDANSDYDIDDNVIEYSERS